MDRKIFLICIGLTFLVAVLFLGTPFEFLNAAIDTIATILTLIAFVVLFILLFKQIRQVNNKVLKWATLVVLIMLAVPYLLIGIWTSLLTFSDYRPKWQDTHIYTNEKGEKVISQWRETSGSIYDYRYRKIFADFGQFRVSLDCNTKKLKGVWTEYNIETGMTKMKNFDTKEKPSR